jgi:WD40 repeat protein/ankyrin repeat protein
MKMQDAVRGFLTGFWMCLISQALVAQEPAADTLPPGAAARIGSTAYWHPGGESLAVAFSPDSQILASAVKGNDFRARSLGRSGQKPVYEIRLWEPRTGKLIRALTPASPVGSLVFMPGGKLLAATDGISIVLWDVTTGQHVRTWEAHSNRVFRLEFSPDGSRLASADESGLVSLWNPTTGKLIRVAAQHQHGVTSLSFSPDGKQLVTSSAGDAIFVWDVDSDKELYKIPVDASVTSSAAFYPRTGELAVLGSVPGNLGIQRGVVRFRNLQTGSDSRTILLDQHERSTTIAFSADSKRMALSESRGSVKILDVASGAKLLEVSRSGLEPSFAFSPDGELAVTTVDSWLQVWDVKTGESLLSRNGACPTVRTPVISPDGRVLAIQDEKGIVLWDLLTRRELMRIAGGVGRWKRNGSTRFSADGRWLIGPSGDWRADDLGIWEVASGELVHRVVAPDMEGGFALSTDNKRVILKSRFGNVNVLDLASGKKITNWQAPGRWPTVSFSPRGDLALVGESAGGNEAASVFDAETGQQLWAIPAAKYGDSRVFTPDGKRICKRDADSLLRIYDARTGKQTVAAPVPENHRLLDVSADESIAVMMDQTGAICLWKLTTGKELLRLPASAGGRAGAVLTPDVKTLVTREPGNCLLIWDVARAITLTPPTPPAPPKTNPSAQPEFPTDRQVLAAVASGNLEQVKRFIARDPGLLSRRITGRTLLGTAVVEGQAKIVQALLTAGADVEGRNAARQLFNGIFEPDGTPLYLAVARGDREMVNSLLAAGASRAFTRPGMPESALWIAAEKGNVELVKLFLSQGDNLNGSGGAAGGPLHAAIANGHLEVVRLLLDAGADPNRTSYWRPALHVAAERGRLELVKELITRGADPNVRGAYQRTLVQAAAFNRNREIVEWLASQGIEVDLFSAAAIGDMRRAEQIVAAEPKAVSERLPDGRTPLHMAVEAGQQAMVQYLLDHGADANARNQEFETPLDKAVATQEIEALLTAHGGKKTERDERAKLWEVLEKKPLPLYGQPFLTNAIYLYPGGVRYAYSLSTFLAIENVAGRRVTRVEIEDAERRINMEHDPARGFTIQVATGRGANRKSTTYADWDAVRSADPQALLAYDKVRTKIEAENIEDDGRIRGGWGAIGYPPPVPIMGVRCENAPQGCRIVDVVESLPAERAGLRAGDLVRKVTGRQVEDFASLLNVVGLHDVGDKIAVVIDREGNEMTVDITLVPRPFDGSGIFLLDGGSIMGRVINSP